MITTVLIVNIIFLLLCVIGSILEDCAPLTALTTAILLLNLYILSLLW